MNATTTIFVLEIVVIPRLAAPIIPILMVQLVAKEKYV
jgi:hypothetical protein